MAEIHKPTATTTATHTVRVELGRQAVPPEQLDALADSGVLELDAEEYDLVALTVDGKIVARGTLTAVDGHIGVRVESVTRNE